MKSLYIKTGFVLASAGSSLCAFAQDVNRTIDYDPEKNKLIPDKVFEIGLPLLVIILLANALVSIFKTRAENRLKEKALDKNLSEATLVALFAENNSLEKMVFLKWFILLLALSLALFTIHFIGGFPNLRSGYLSVGILCFFLSIGFLIYYRMIRRN